MEKQMFTDDLDLLADMPSEEVTDVDDIPSQETTAILKEDE